MVVSRANVDFAKRLFNDRVGDPYVYGGTLDANNTDIGTDCSGLVGSILEALTNGPGMSWARHVSTESWPYDYNTNTPAPAGTVGPYGTISVGGRHIDRIPSDAAAIIAIMHGGGGENSHIEIQVDGQVMESGGAHNDVGSAPETPITHPEWTDYWYLPGPVGGSGSAVKPVSSSDRYAQAIIDEGQRRGITPRGIQIALATALVESGDPLQMWANSTVSESLNLPHDAVGSDHDSLGLFQQRCPMWGPADVLMDPTQSAGLFYDHLVKFDYNGSDSPGSYAQAVQVSAFPDRYDGKFDAAVQLYTRLTTTQSSGGVFMALTDAEQRELLELARQQSSYRRVSRSPLRHVGEGEIATATEFELNVDGNVHVLLVQRLAELGDPDSLNLLNEVANLDVARYPDRAHDRLLAQAILNQVAGRATVASAPPVGVTPGVVAATPVAAAPVQTAVPVAAPVETSPTGTGLFAELGTLRDQIHTITSTVNQITGGN